MEREELERLISYTCSYSMYAFEEEISRGYLSLPGGHRMGLAGEVVLSERDKIRNIKHISCINIRISHEIKGAADTVLPFLYREGRFLNTLIDVYKRQRLIFCLPGTSFFRLRESTFPVCLPEEAGMKELPTSAAGLR